MTRNRKSRMASALFLYFRCEITAHAAASYGEWNCTGRNQSLAG